MGQMTLLTGLVPENNTANFHHFPLTALSEKLLSNAKPTFLKKQQWQKYLQFLYDDNAFNINI